MRFTVTGPLPPKELSPNGRVHWGTKARATKLFRESWWAAFKEARIPQVEQAVITLEFYTAMTKFRDRYRPTDPDNALASCKALIDALVDAGVIKFDSRKHLRINEPRIYGRKKEHGGRSCVVATIEVHDDS